MRSVIGHARSEPRASREQGVAASPIRYIYVLAARFVLLEATVRASTYARATGSSAGYLAALRAVRQHPLWRRAGCAASHVAYVTLDPLHEDVWYLFAVRRGDVPVEAGVGLGGQTGESAATTEDVLALLLVSSGAIAALDDKCVWGSGPVTVDCQFQGTQREQNP